MNRQDDYQDQEPADEAAACWVLRVEAPDATEADWLALQAWLSAAPERRLAYDRAERVSAELAMNAAALLSGLDNHRLTATAPRRLALGRLSLGRRNPQRLRAWPAAAGLAAAAAAAVLFIVLRPEPPAPTDVYQTAKGQSRELALADGSHVHLNSGSRLTVRLERKARYVQLAEGEAAFDVAKDHARPFLIDAGQRSIRVVGTEFDVLRHNGDLRVTVRRGVVAVQSPGAAPGDEPVLLRVGDQFEQRSGAPVATVRQVDPDAAFAWREGELVYRDQSLAAVAEDLNRYYDTPVRVTGAAAALRFSGILKLDGEDQVVRRLQGFLHVSAEHGRDGVTLALQDAAH